MKNSTAKVGHRLTSHKGFLMVLGLILVVLAGLLVSRRAIDMGFFRPAATSLDLSDLRNEADAPALADLENALEKEVLARQALSDRISELEARANVSRRTSNEVYASLDEDKASDSIGDALDSDEAQPPLDEQSSRFNDETLLALGVDPRDAARLRDGWVSHQMDRAALLDRSLREGWFTSARRQREFQKLDQEFRAALGDDEYDQVLYALGEQNRIRVREVLDGSPASDAGLRRNDVLLAYDGNRIFKPIELLLNSSSGLSGESAPIEILRDGQRQTVYVRRGPLGILMKHEQGVPLSE